MILTCDMCMYAVINIFLVCSNMFEQGRKMSHQRETVMYAMHTWYIESLAHADIAACIHRPETQVTIITNPVDLDIIDHSFFLPIIPFSCIIILFSISFPIILPIYILFWQSLVIVTFTPCTFTPVIIIRTHLVVGE